jgi:hypothetical protein
MNHDKSPRGLTPEEQRLFTTIPDDLSTAELVRFYAFSSADKEFIFQRRGAANRLDAPTPTDRAHDTGHREAGLACRIYCKINRLARGRVYRRITDPLSGS